MIENNETMIADLLSYAKAFEGRAGTSGYAIAAKNAALAIRNQGTRIRDLEAQLHCPERMDGTHYCRWCESTIDSTAQKESQ